MRPVSRNIPRAVALGAFVAVLGFPGDAAETPEARPVLPGEFDPEAALESVYGRPDLERDRPSWTLPRFPDEPMKADVLGVLPFRQDGDERMFLLTTLVPLEGDYACHVCAPAIGAATFTRTAAGWRLDVRTPHVTDLGSYGKAPDPALVKVGPERYAVVFDSGGVAQGHHVTLSSYLLESETGVREALAVETHSDNSGACDPDGETDRPCWVHDSSLEFIPGENAEYFDLKVTTTGPGEGEFQEEAVYAVTDGTYRVTRTRTVDYRMVVHPVSAAELPRIRLPARPAVEQAVNDELEARAADLICSPDLPGEDRWYESHAEVTYADNDVFSVAIVASFHCGGAHPVNGADDSVTFDLRTGKPVRLGELFEDYERDATKIAAAYAATLTAEDLEGCEDVLVVSDGANRGAVTETDLGGLETYGFDYTVSPRGVMLQPSFPNAFRACAHRSIVPFERLREFAAPGGILLRLAGDR